MSSDKSFATMQLVAEENLQIFAIQEQCICHLCAAQNRHLAFSREELSRFNFCIRETWLFQHAEGTSQANLLPLVASIASMQVGMKQHGRDGPVAAISIRLLGRRLICRFVQAQGICLGACAPDA